MTVNQNSPEMLRQEILAEARKMSEEILSQARCDAETFVNNSVEEAKKIKRQKLDEANAEADRRCELIIAAVPVETGRMRLERIESLLDSVRDEARRILLDREGFDYRKAIVSLASLAIGKMTGATFVVKLPDMDMAGPGEDLAEEITLHAGRPVDITLVYEQGMTGGVIVEDNEGRQTWDNRLVSRLERLWPELRRQIALEAAFIPTKESTGDSL